MRQQQVGVLKFLDFGLLAALCRPADSRPFATKLVWRQPPAPIVESAGFVQNKGATSASAACLTTRKAQPPSDKAGAIVSTCSKLCDEGQLADAVEALTLLVEQGYVTCTSLLYRVLKRCIAGKDLVLGKRVHALILKSGYESNAFLANHVICMYASHGKLNDASAVFNKVAVPNAHMWASIILAHARHGQPAQAIKLYQQMQETSVKPDNHIFLAVLQACANAGDLEEAMQIFSEVAAPNLHMWSSIILAHGRHGQPQQAVGLYQRMRKSGVKPDNHIFVAVLSACATAGDLGSGKVVHADILENEDEHNIFVGNCLIHMYATCGSLEDAQRVFDSLPNKDVVTWTSMITAYSENGLAQEALNMYASMQEHGMTPANRVTYVCLLQACASVGALHHGKHLHAQVQESGLELDEAVSSSLVAMYSACGSLADARRVFDRLPTKNVVTWTALLNGYAQHSDGKLAMQCFEEMRQHGLEPDDVTFICLLVACSHAGLVNEGRRYFKMMEEDYRIMPSVKHFICMVDLLGRSGHLDEAEDLLQNMPFDHDVVGWTSLLTACKSHEDLVRGRRCFNRITELQPDNAAAYILLGNIYANAGRWSDVDKLESLRKSAGAKKVPAKACIEVKNKVHEFTVGEEMGGVSLRLRSMNVHIKDEGHVPNTELVLNAVSNVDKEEALCGHAEKLALAYGLLNTPSGATLLVTKNLRMCNDCHSSTKIMSRLENRKIIVRDAHCVHHFMEGFCSCKDRH